MWRSLGWRMVAGLMALGLVQHLAVAAPAAEPVVILKTSEAGSELWRFTTEKPAETWMQPEFKDQDWKQGKGGFGTADTPGAKVGTAWTTADVWLRQRFTLAKQPRLLRLRVHHDEDVEIYLNGVLACKETGWITAYELLPLAAAARQALVVGENVIAVHCHQTAGGQYVDAGLEEAPALADQTLPGHGFDLVTQTDDAGTRLQLVCAGQVLVTSPAEGLWSVATDWQAAWPAQWKHGGPDQIRRDGEWLVLTGRIQAEAGDWLITDAYRSEGNVIRNLRRWQWKGRLPAAKTTLSVRWILPQAKSTARPLLPGICYYGNPAGTKTGPGNVAQYSGKPDQELYCEEHRFPMPFVALEWPQDQGWRAAALHSLPSPVPYGCQADQWWSLGLVNHPTGVELSVLSGPLSINGQRGFVKANQGRMLSYGDAWLTVPPNGIIEKTTFLEAFSVAKQGSGFCRPVQTSLALFQPFSVDGLPKVATILKSKYQFTVSRWHEDKESAGFRMYPHNHDYVMGWAGQSEAPGYALLVLARQLGDPRAVEMAQRALDHLSTSPFNQNGFMVGYNPDKNQWYAQDPVSQGQAMDSFANAIRYGRQHPPIKTAAWEAFLQKACDIHAARILATGWKPRSTNEGFLVAPLCKGYALFGKDAYRQAALKAAEEYGKRHLDMSEPYWGGTLDASCEDKEGAWAGFQAFLAAYEMTQEPKYLAWAEHALSVVLTYTVVWDIDMPASRMRDHGLKTRGWTMVSAQNQHLDVFGVLFTPEIYKMGTYLKREDLQKLAMVMYRSCGQLIDPFGSQGEQIDHTNFAQHGNLNDVHQMRGSYSEGWTVYWITAHFLNAAAKFTEMGVNLDK